MLFEEKHSKQNYNTTLHYQNMHTILHCQTSAEILLITRGIVHAVCQHEVYRLSAGKAIWVMPYEVHSYDTIEENDATVYIHRHNPGLFSIHGWQAADPAGHFLF